MIVFLSKYFFQFRKVYFIHNQTTSLEKYGYTRILGIQEGLLSASVRMEIGKSVLEAENKAWEITGGVKHQI